jgi:hypothetical protein
MIRQTEIHTAEPILPEPSAAEVEVAIRNLKSYKAPAPDQIPAELIQAFWDTQSYYADLEQRGITSPVERVSCCTYSQKGW